MYELIRTYTDIISAGHKIKGYMGKCAFNHGHNWDVEVIYKGEDLNKLQMLVDFRDVDKIVLSITSQLDHRVLNNVLKSEIITAEILTKWIYDRLKEMKMPNGVILANVTVWETRGHAIRYYESE